MADLAEKKNEKVEETKLPDVELKVESTRKGNRVSLELDLGDFKVNFDLPMGDFAARYLEEKGIINP